MSKATKQTISMIKAALRGEALARVLEYHSWGRDQLEAPDFWRGAPDAMDILRDIFRGYVLAGGKDFTDGDELNWSKVGLEADRLLLDALDEMDYGVEIFCTQIDCTWGYTSPDQSAANDALTSHLREAHP